MRHEISTMEKGGKLKKKKNLLVIPLELPKIHLLFKVGHKIFMDDGRLQLKVERLQGQRVFCKVLHGGLLHERKGVNLPGISLPLKAMTQKDKKDLKFGLQQGVDYVALSFVRQVSDLQSLRRLIQKLQPHTSQAHASQKVKIIAKIEKLEALQNLRGLVEASDAVMVARGDLGVELHPSLLPGKQKEIIALCNVLRKPVITATQMMESMVESPSPTRAEMTDIANAVLDGSDALMLSAETASGKYPHSLCENHGQHH